MGYTQIRYLGTTSASYTNNALYDVLGWGVQNGEPWAIIVNNDNTLSSIDIRENVEWEVANTTVVMAISF